MLEAAFQRAWRPPSGVRGWFSTVDHKQISIRYAFTAFGFLFLSGTEGILLRVQLTTPQSQLLGPELYNEIFSTHGTTMVFFFAIPIMQAAAGYLIPLMIGTRNVIFPRLLAFSYWTYL